MAGGNKFNGGELRGEFLGSNSVSTALADNRIRQDSGTCRQKLTAWVGLLCCESLHRNELTEPYGIASFQILLLGDSGFL